MQEHQDILREYFDAALEDGSAELRTVAQKAIKANRRAFFRNHAKSIEDEAVNWLRKYARSREEADAQLPLPDFKLPGVIAVRQEGGEVRYVRTDKCRWEELQAGRAERIRHVMAAQDKLDAYDRSLDFLRPRMANDPDMTVAEALK